MTGVLIDTSIIIDYTRIKDKSQTILFYLINLDYQVFASIVTHTESYGGKSIWEKKESMETMNTLFSQIKILPLDEKISKSAGKIRATYNSAPLDAIIAATALSNNLKLATLNIKDFKKITGVKLFPYSK